MVSDESQGSGFQALPVPARHISTLNAQVPQPLGKRMPLKCQWHMRQGRTRTQSCVLARMDPSARRRAEGPSPLPIAAAGYCASCMKATDLWRRRQSDSLQLWRRGFDPYRRRPQGVAVDLQAEPLRWLMGNSPILARSKWDSCRCNIMIVSMSTAQERDGGRMHAKGGQAGVGVGRDGVRVS
jgi:hypothetical protein